MIILAVVAPLMTYLIAARKLTGEVKTSDATDLWAESKSIREWSADRITELTETINTLEARIKILETANDTLQAVSNELHATLSKCSSTIDRLTTQLEISEKQVTNLKEQLVDLAERRKRPNPTHPAKRRKEDPK